MMNTSFAVVDWWILLERSRLTIEILLHLSDAVPLIGFEKMIPIKPGP